MLVIRLITHGEEYFRRGRLIYEVVLPLTGLAPVCTENLIRVDDVLESPKLVE